MKKKLLISGLVAASALVVLLSLFAMYQLPGSGSCGSCHDNIAKGMKNEAHAKLACVDCHVGTGTIERFRFGWTMISGMYLHVTDPRNSTFAQVADSQCSSNGCHASLPTLTTGSIRFNHAACTDGNRCAQCHNRVAHRADLRSSIDMFDCLGCHREKGRTLQCTACHEGRRDIRSKTSTFAVTHGTQWQTTHGMGNSQSCGVCHNNRTCFRCHGPGVPHPVGYMRTHGADARSADAKCANSVCHKQSFCDTCHKDFKLPHPTSFVQTHSKLVKSQGDKKCYTCHDPNDCSDCHTRHVHPGGAISRNRSGN